MKRGLCFIFIVLACSLFGLSTILEAQQHDRKKDKHAVIDCWNKRFITLGEANEYTNYVHEGKKIKWDAYGPENTIVKIVFKANTNYQQCHGTAPDDGAISRQETIDDSEHTDLELKVKAGKGGPDDTDDKECYVYEVYCGTNLLPWETPAAALDPIIEVPKP